MKGALLAALVACAPWAAFAADPPPERKTSPVPQPKAGFARADAGVPELVWVVGLEGLPADSLLRAAFERGFRLGLESRELPTESPADTGDAGSRAGA